MKDLKNSMQSEVFVAKLLPGFVTALLDIIISISFAAIVFSGDPSVFLSRGIGSALFTTTAVSVFLALTSHFSGVIAVTQVLSGKTYHSKVDRPHSP